MKNVIAILIIHFSISLTNAISCAAIGLIEEVENGKGAQLFKVLSVKQKSGTSVFNVKAEKDYFNANSKVDTIVVRTLSGYNNKDHLVADSLILLTKESECVNNKLNAEDEDVYLIIDGYVINPENLWSPNGEVKKLKYSKIKSKLTKYFKKSMKPKSDCND